MTDDWALSIDADGIAWLVLDRRNQSLNSLSGAVLDGLAGVLDSPELASARALVLASGKEDSFIVGADVKEFTSIGSRDRAIERIRSTHALFSRIEALSIPVVAMINGHCLGGGFELALACRYRVAVEDARLGFPEVLLGIHPGFGGSVRSIRCAGPLAALELMLTGRRLPAKVAQRMGLVDRVVPARHLHRAVLQVFADKPPVKRAEWWRRLPSLAPLRPLVAAAMRREVRRRARLEHYPAPYALIDLWQRDAGDPVAMLRAEGESVADLISGDTAQNLVRLFLLQDRLKALAGSGDGKDVQRVHLIGAGVMGGDIAAWCCLQGLDVSVEDPDAQALGRFLKRARTLFQRRLRDRRRVRLAMDRLLADPAGAGLARADLVIEAVPENLALKQEILTRAEQRAPAGALIASNTSSLDLDDLAAGIEQPQRLVGLHFFNPVAKMQLVEVVSSRRTDPAVQQRALEFVRAIARLPLPVRNLPGFLVNRVLTPYVLEATLLVEQGQRPEDVDEAALAFGMPVGPIELADTVGLDICAAVADNLGHPLPSTVAGRLREGALGRKQGRGFYTWKKGRPVKKRVSADIPESLSERLVLRYLNESVAAHADGVCDDRDLIDAGLVFGSGFAPFTGGALHYIDKHGADELRSRLATLESTLGERFRPHPRWSEWSRREEIRNGS